MPRGRDLLVQARGGKVSLSVWLEWELQKGTGGLGLPYSATGSSLWWGAIDSPPEAAKRAGYY